MTMSGWLFHHDEAFVSWTDFAANFSLDVCLAHCKAIMIMDNNVNLWLDAASKLTKSAEMSTEGAVWTAGVQEKRVCRQQSSQPIYICYKAGSRHEHTAAAGIHKSVELLTRLCTI